MSSSMQGLGGFGSTGKPQKLGSTGLKTMNVQQFTPEQLSLFQSLFSSVGPESFTSRLAGGDQGAFDEIESPALQQFSGIQGGIASRFSQGEGGKGNLGARKSSGFQNYQNSAASDFAQRLQSNRYNIQRQAIQDLHGMSSSLLGQRPYEQYAYEPQKKKSFWDSLFGIGAPAAGAIAGGLIGGPGGAMIGGQIGSSAAQGFSGY